jgi:hypothetical protein
MAAISSAKLTLPKQARIRTIARRTRCEDGFFEVDVHAVRGRMRMRKRMREIAQRRRSHRRPHPHHRDYPKDLSKRRSEGRSIASSFIVVSYVDVSLNQCTLFAAMLAFAGVEPCVVCGREGLGMRCGQGGKGRGECPSVRCGCASIDCCVIVLFHIVIISHLLVIRHSGFTAQFGQTCSRNITEAEERTREANRQT